MRETLAIGAPPQCSATLSRLSPLSSRCPCRSRHGACDRRPSCCGRRASRGSTGISAPPSSCQHRLHLPDIALALGLVGFGLARRPAACRTSDCSNAISFHGAPRLIGDRQHLRRGRAAAPVARRRMAPFSQTLSKKPSAGSFFTLDLDAGLAGARLEQRRHVDRAVEGGVGCLQHDRRIGRRPPS